MIQRVIFITWTLEPVFPRLWYYHPQLQAVVGVLRSKLSWWTWTALKYIEIK